MRKISSELWRCPLRSRLVRLDLTEFRGIILPYLSPGPSRSVSSKAWLYIAGERGRESERKSEIVREREWVEVREGERKWETDSEKESGKESVSEGMSERVGERKWEIVREKDKEFSLVRHDITLNNAGTNYSRNELFICPFRELNCCQFQWGQFLDTFETYSVKHHSHKWTSSVCILSMP